MDATNGTVNNQDCQTLDINQSADIAILTPPSANCAPYATTIDFSSSKVLSTATVDYGDGVIDVLTPNATTFSANHTYSQEGTYSITVSAVDLNGCSSTSSKANVVTVRNINSLGFVMSLSSCQVPLTATFVNTTPNLGNYTFSWIMEMDLQARLVIRTHHMTTMLLEHTMSH